MLRFFNQKVVEAVTKHLVAWKFTRHRKLCCKDIESAPEKVAIGSCCKENTMRYERNYEEH